MNLSVLSAGSAIALLCLLLLLGLEVYFLVKQNMFLFFSGAAMIFWSCDKSLVPALRYDGVIR